MASADERPDVRAVVFDIGETLLDRTREYAEWARFFEVPAHTFSAVFGAMIADGASVSDVLRFFGNGMPVDELYVRRAEAGFGVGLEERDLYPDVREAIAALKRQGIAVGIAGNQPASTSEQLRRLDLGADVIGSSAEWDVAKPSRDFFLRAAAEVGVAPGSTVYVGDQLDNDVVAPQAAGLRAIRVVRGPWGFTTRDAKVEATCLAVVRELTEIPAVLRGESPRITDA
jgi:HAD superfamily hydrolase (TIGR01662 family)